ncbi:hypothetical protein L2E82_18805 [Cichorium intybus]|uniref:Uncharacterized protein n=1 Tax=Cichorium intybus TaxID=13427 RepID=A0ACB9FC56_CICIN|nr:hypothetical protein L2E82_18805 [Cichorium intybus]
MGMILQDDQTQMGMILFPTSHLRHLQADGIITYLKKQVAPASIEIKTSQHVESLVDDIKSSIIWIFPKFSGDKFDNFMVLAEKLRSDYDFGHTTNAELIPRGESSVTKPTLRLLKPFDELFLAFTESKVDAMENFIEESSTPLVTLFDQSPEYSVFLSKYFESEDAKVMFLVDYSHEEIENLRTIYHEVAALYKGKGLKFLMGNVPDSKGVFQKIVVQEDLAPVIIAQNTDGLKYVQPNVQISEIVPWLKDYTEGKLKPFIKCEAIPETNDELVKVVVAKSLRDMVLDSKNNDLRTWCGHCNKLAPILDEVAVSFEKDPNVVIAKLTCKVFSILNLHRKISPAPARPIPDILEQLTDVRTHSSIFSCTYALFESSQDIQAAAQLNLWSPSFLHLCFTRATPSPEIFLAACSSQPSRSVSLFY